MENEIYSYLKRNKVINPQVMATVAADAAEDKYWTPENSQFQFIRRVAVPDSLPENGIDSDGVYWKQTADGNFVFSFDTDRKGNLLEIKNELFISFNAASSGNSVIPAIVFSDKIEEVTLELYEKRKISFATYPTFGQEGILLKGAGVLAFFNNAKAEKQEPGVVTHHLLQQSKFFGVSGVIARTGYPEQRKAIMVCAWQGGSLDYGFVPGSEFYFMSR